jgi:hypothetical protein
LSDKAIFNAVWVSRTTCSCAGFRHAPLSWGHFRNWTHEQAADASMGNIDALYALNLQPEKQTLGYI